MCISLNHNNNMNNNNSSDNIHISIPPQCCNVSVYSYRSSRIFYDDRSCRFVLCRYCSFAIKRWHKCL